MGSHTINGENLNGMFQTIIYIFYFMILMSEIFLSKYLLNFNRIMPVNFKVKDRNIIAITISIIVSSLFMSLSFLGEGFHRTTNFMFLLGTFMLFFSFVVSWYYLFYMTYRSGKILNSIYINNKSRWWIDETCFKFTVLIFLYFILSSYFVLYFYKIDHEKGKIIGVMIYSALNLLLFFYYYGLYKTKKHFEKMILTYVDISDVSEYLYKEQHIRYMAYKYNSKNYTDI